MEPHVVLTDLPRLAATDVRLLWVNDFYDAPIEAVVEHGGERYLLVLHERPPIDVTKPMHWVLFHLAPEEWREEDRWHALFEEVVGHHWCFHHDPPVDPPDSLNGRDPNDFFGPYRARTPRVLGAPHGFVDELPAR